MEHFPKEREPYHEVYFVLVPGASPLKQFYGVYSDLFEHYTHAVYFHPLSQCLSIQGMPLTSEHDVNSDVGATHFHLANFTGKRRCNQSFLERVISLLVTCYKYHFKRVDLLFKKHFRQNPTL